MSESVEPKFIWMFPKVWADPDGACKLLKVFVRTTMEWEEFPTKSEAVKFLGEQGWEYDSEDQGTYLYKKKQ